MPSPHSLSVIIIARDEADRIRPCLDSVRDLADEIIVLDSRSEDGTAAICREYTEHVFVTPDWPGDGVQKQRALDRATCEWVLRIDADERLSRALRDEISAVLSRPAIAETAFRIRWTTWVFGRYLNHGECGVGHFNLFRREGASFSSRVVHSSLVPAPGPTRTLRSRLIHDAHRDFHHLVRKLTDYACFAAAESAASGRRTTLFGAYVRSWWRWCRVYVVKLGFLDGWRGLLLATVYRQYVFNKWAALFTEIHSTRRPPPSTPDEGDGSHHDESRIRPVSKGDPGIGTSAPVSDSIE